MQRTLSWQNLAQPKLWNHHIKCGSRKVRAAQSTPPMLRLGMPTVLTEAECQEIWV